MECARGTFLLIALRKALLHDLDKIEIDCSDFELELRPYSKCYYGRYYTKKKKIVLYVYQDKDRETPYDYFHLLITGIHEACHHLQWEDPDWTRLKGVMHDKSFWEMWRKYTTLYRNHISNEERKKDYDKFLANRDRG